MRKRYELKRVLGNGSYGLVVLAIDTTTQEQVAIKRISNIFSHEQDSQRILREVRREKERERVNKREGKRDRETERKRDREKERERERRKRRKGERGRIEGGSIRHDIYNLTILPAAPQPCACDVTQIYILRSLSHPNLIRLHDIPQPYDAINSFEDLYLVFEFVDTDMYKLIQSPQYVLHGLWVIGGGGSTYIHIHIHTSYSNNSFTQSHPLIAHCRPQGTCPFNMFRCFYIRSVSHVYFIASQVYLSNLSLFFK